jgi:transposase
MGQAISMAVREQFIRLKAQRHSLSAISEQLDLRYGTACKLSAQLKAEGSLSLHYQHCGPKDVKSNPLLVRASCWLRRLHPGWGAPFIRLQLVRRYGAQGVPKSRTLQRWFRRWKLTKPRQQVNQPSIGTATAVHNIWQVDAKENLTLHDGSPACYLTITDEHSGAGLAALVFPPPLYSAGAPARGPRKAPGGL